MIACGSEVNVAISASELLEAKGVQARVVSMPCATLFDQQSEEYRESVLPKNVRARVCVEAGSSYSWYKYAGLDGKVIAIDSFGKSAPAGVLFDLFGFTAENIAKQALEII